MSQLLADDDIKQIDYLAEISILTAVLILTCQFMHENY